MAVSAVLAPDRRLPRPTCWALGIALVWGAVLVVGALTVHTYHSQTWQNTAANQAVLLTSSATLVGHDGLHVLAPAGAPLVVAALVAALLWRETRGHRGAEILAWLLTGLLGVVTVLGMLTIGAFLLPVTVALLVACGTAHRPARWRGG